MLRRDTVEKIFSLLSPLNYMLFTSARIFIKRNIKLFYEILTSGLYVEIVVFSIMFT
jgi:hypothetical protein